MSYWIICVPVFVTQKSHNNHRIIFNMDLYMFATALCVYSINNLPLFCDTKIITQHWQSPSDVFQYHFRYCYCSFFLFYVSEVNYSKGNYNQTGTSIKNCKHLRLKGTIVNIIMFTLFFVSWTFHVILLCLIGFFTCLGNGNNSFYFDTLNK